MVLEGAWRAVLFWRHIPLDRGGRGDGLCAAIGSATRHAELRRICQEGPVARPALNGDEWLGAECASLGEVGPRGDFSWASGRWKGHAGESAGRKVRRTASFDRRHAARE